MGLGWAVRSRSSRAAEVWVLWFSFEIHQALCKIVSYKNKQRKTPIFLLRWLCSQSRGNKRECDSSTDRHVGRVRKCLSWCRKTKPRRWKRTKWVGEICIPENRRLKWKPPSHGERLARVPHISPLCPSLTRFRLLWLPSRPPRRERISLGPCQAFWANGGPLFPSSATFPKCWYAFCKSRGDPMAGSGAGLQKKHFTSWNQDRTRFKPPPLGRRLTCWWPRARVL